MVPGVQAWLQRFAWMEKKLERRKKVRNALPADRTLLSQEPMFCFETAVKLLYWCGFVYEHDEAGRMVRSSPLPPPSYPPPPPPPFTPIYLPIRPSCPPLERWNTVKTCPSAQSVSFQGVR